MTVTHEPSAVLLEFLDGKIETHADHGAGAVLHEIGDTDLFCVLFVYRRQLLGFEALVQHAFKARCVQFAVFQRRQRCDAVRRVHLPEDVTAVQREDFVVLEFFFLV